MGVSKPLNLQRKRALAWPTPVRRYSLGEVPCGLVERYESLGLSAPSITIGDVEYPMTEKANLERAVARLSVDERADVFEDLADLVKALADEEVFVDVSGFVVSEAQLSTIIGTPTPSTIEEGLRMLAYKRFRLREVVGDAIRTQYGGDGGAYVFGYYSIPYTARPVNWLVGQPSGLPAKMAGLPSLTLSVGDVSLYGPVVRIEAPNSSFTASDDYLNMAYSAIAPAGVYTSTQTLNFTASSGSRYYLSGPVYSASGYAVHGGIVRVNGVQVFPNFASPMDVTHLLSTGSNSVTITPVGSAFVTTDLVISLRREVQGLGAHDNRVLKPTAGGNCLPWVRRMSGVKFWVDVISDQNFSCAAPLNVPIKEQRSSSMRLLPYHVIGEVNRTGSTFAYLWEKDGTSAVTGTASVTSPISVVPPLVEQPDPYVVSMKIGSPVGQVDVSPIEHAPVPTYPGGVSGTSMFSGFQDSSTKFRRLEIRDWDTCYFNPSATVYEGDEIICTNPLTTYNTGIPSSHGPGTYYPIVIPFATAQDWYTRVKWITNTNLTIDETTNQSSAQGSDDATDNWFPWTSCSRVATRNFTFTRTTVFVDSAGFNGTASWTHTVTVMIDLVNGYRNGNDFYPRIQISTVGAGDGINFSSLIAPPGTRHGVITADIGGFTVPVGSSWISGWDTRPGDVNNTTFTIEVIPSTATGTRVDGHYVYEANGDGTATIVESTGGYATRSGYIVGTTMPMSSVDALTGTAVSNTKRLSGIFNSGCGNADGTRIYGLLSDQVPLSCLSPESPCELCSGITLLSTFRSTYNFPTDFNNGVLPRSYSGASLTGITPVAGDIVSNGEYIQRSGCGNAGGPYVFDGVLFKFDDLVLKDFRFQYDYLLFDGCCGGGKHRLMMLANNLSDPNSAYLAIGSWSNNCDNSIIDLLIQLNQTAVCREEYPPTEMTSIPQTHNVWRTRVIQKVGQEVIITDGTSGPTSITRCWFDLGGRIGMLIGPGVRLKNITIS